MSQDTKEDPSHALELAHLYERAPIALCVTDKDHRYVRLNQRLCDINGKTMEEHVGRTVHEVIPDLADQIVPMFQCVIDTAEPVLDYEVRGETLRHPGEERVFFGNHFPLSSKAGEVQYVHTMVRDITDQRRAEASLREANDRLEVSVRQRTEELRRFRAVIQAATDAIVGANGDGEITFFNPAAEATFGYRSDDILRKPLWHLMPERYRDAHRKGLERYKLTSEAHVMGKTVELWGLRKDGTEFPLELSLSTWETTEGSFYTGIIRDITERKRAEERLEEHVRVRTEELVRLSEELKAEVAERVRAQEEASVHHAQLAHVSRVRSMGELAASISHELNQPLAAVLANAQAALRLLEEKKLDLEELHEILEDIVADDKRAGQVIRRLRAMLQKEPVAQESVRLDELLSEVLPLVRSDALGANVRINVKSAPNLPPVQIDPVQVQQVVLNLLVNAIDAMRTLESEGGDIEVEISRAGKDSVLVTVSDNGPGIPAKEISEVFKLFVTTKTGGLGMGLAICKSILDAHGGTISVESNVPRGCCFSFMLLLKQPAAS